MKILRLLPLVMLAGCAAPSVPAAEPQAPAARQLQAVAGQAFYVSAPYAAPITPGSATINWQTGTPARGQLEYGTSGSLGLKGPTEAKNATSHRLTLGGLWPGTWYYVRARCTDASGRVSYSATKQFRTTW
ncbi:MAG: Endo,4-beta-xylanase precursor [Cyanobacteria bacterium RYN_339]|nr:Endo,4-beta-xylanase precursor [Cyanobacteria bacterium RYN_339]